MQITFKLYASLGDYLPADVRSANQMPLVVAEGATIAQVMLAYTSLDATAKALVDAANEAGGKDNIAVVLARAPGGAPVATRSWWPFKREAQ